MHLEVKLLTFLFTVILPLSYGFTCYKCSYNLGSEQKQTDCITNPANLGRGAHLSCNETSYCVLQENFDFQQNVVTSYFRTCMGVSLGNECQKYEGLVICRSSCQGNYCNEHENGTNYQSFVQKFPNEFNGAKHLILSRASHVISVLSGALLVYCANQEVG
ncbi:uncharacterized protein LOC127859399 isoform X2 [Dreissena polymorpha]|uniref:Uncharacterized protein n=1 Tax=Dreissena polymorpha TaxID=45954 RepID=A0A9D3YN36_DREPO|nr:uncharacterized protein LOC127859399 isoform X2 [Dreissena polymorpha]KAH3701128.1 hypothetical protein DPMN_076112 [Dreissena polymorpha]